MVSRLLVLLLFISCAQALSSTSHFLTFFTSESRGLNHSSGQTQEFLGRLYGSIKDKTRFEGKVEQRKNELSDTLRKPHGGGGMGGGRGTGGSYGGGNMNRHPRPTRSSATSLLEVPCFWVSTLTPFVLWL